MNKIIAIVCLVISAIAIAVMLNIARMQGSPEAPIRPAERSVELSVTANPGKWTVESCMKQSGAEPATDCDNADMLQLQELINKNAGLD